MYDIEKQARKQRSKRKKKEKKSRIQRRFSLFPRKEKKNKEYARRTINRPDEWDRYINIGIC